MDKFLTHFKTIKLQFPVNMPDEVIEQLIYEAEKIYNKYFEQAADEIRALHPDIDLDDA